MTAVRPSPRYQLWITLLAVAMVYLLVGSLSSFWRVNAPSATLLAFASAAGALGWLRWRFPRSSLLLLLLAVAGAAAASLYLPPWQAYLKALGRYLQEYVAGMQQDLWMATFAEPLGTVFLLLLALAAGPLILREALGRGTAFRSIAAGAAIFGTEWTWFFDRSAGYFMPYLLVAFALWVFGQAARRDAQWANAGRRFAYRSGVAAPVAAILATGLVAVALPSDLQPVELGAIGQKAQTLFPFITQLRGSPVGSGGRFTLASTGFTPTLGVLGGPVSLDDSLALELVLSAPLEETAYLRGTTFRIYNGRTWLPGEPEPVEIPTDGLLPSRLGSDVLRQYRTFQVRPAVNFGRTLFTFLEPMRAEGLAYRADEDSNLMAERNIGAGSAYTVASRIPIYSGEQIRSLSSAAPEEEYRPYLQLPEALPQRVRNLARSITGRAAHPYDKALALESWLRGLTYDLDVPPLPAGRDFVDHFIFDLERGYCTYYSSAMAVMLRELGIPARLVEGFAVPASLEGTEAPDGKLILPVRNSLAHAWVEAYFPDYGWVTFDPTPRADLPVIDRSTPAPAAETEEPGPLSSSPVSGETANQNRAEIPEEPGELGDMLPATTPAAEGKLPWVPFATGALLLLAWAGYRRLQQQDRLPVSEADQVVQEAWVKTDRLMGLFGSGRRPYETHREYARSLGTQWPALQEPAQAMAQAYEQARYAPPQEDFHPESAQQAQTFWRIVRESVVHRYGWQRYLWRRLGLRWPFRRRKS